MVLFTTHTVSRAPFTTTTKVQDFLFSISRILAGPKKLFNIQDKGVKSTKSRKNYTALAHIEN